MNKVLASELGFLGINEDSNFDLAWLQTEVVNKLAQGDKMSAYKLINFARHSEDEAIKTYANQMAEKYADEIDDYVL